MRIPVGTLALIYLAYTTFRAIQFYNYVKSDQRGWSGQVHGAHKELDFVPIPNALGWEIMYLGPDIPMGYDKDGFKIPVDDKLSTKKSSHSNAIVTDVHSELLNRLSTIDEKSYQRKYKHWRGEPPRLVDSHLNEHANKNIAEMNISHMVESITKEK